MKKILILNLILLSFSVFSQKIDLNEKQAFERYKNSNIRRELGFKLSDFDYKDLCRIYKETLKTWFWEYDFSKMKIFNSYQSKNLFLKMVKENKKLYDEIDKPAARTFPYTPLNNKDIKLK